jgi:hypothetical protein
MWPLHSRTRPLGHSFARLPSTGSAAAVCDAAADDDEAAPRPAPPPTPTSPANKRPLSARRARWQNRLSSRPFHIVILLLVLVDLCTIVADLVLVLTHSEYRPTHQVEVATRALAAVSLAILSLFCVEFFAAALVFGARAWFSEPLHIFDVLVVASSLALEAALFHLEAQEFEGLVSLLVAGRLWRLARVAYTATEATKAEEEVAHRSHHRERAVGVAGANEQELERLRRLVASLRAQLAEAGIEEEEDTAALEAEG